MILRDGLRGVDDLIAERALAGRRLLRQRASTPDSRCRRRFVHPHQPTQFDARGSLVVDRCGCDLQMGHDDDCLCEHETECRIYRVDPDGREHYAARPVGGWR